MQPQDQHFEAAIRRFTGVWRFDPMGADYTFGPPPRDGAYTITYATSAYATSNNDPSNNDPSNNDPSNNDPSNNGPNNNAGARLHFDIEWSDGQGRPLRQAIDAVPDDRDYPYPGLPAVDSVRYTLVDRSRLDSTATLQGTVVAHAARVLDEEGAALEIVQSGTRPDGTSFANRSLYRRAESGEQATLLLIERFNRALNAHDVAAMLELLAPDCVFENTAPAPDGERFVGRAAVAEFWRTFFAQAPAATILIEELFVAGDRGVQRWTYRWAKDGPAPGHVRGADVLRVEEGRIAAKYSYVKG